MHLTSHPSYRFLLAALLTLTNRAAFAAVPEDAAARADVVGNPVTLQIQPETLALTGPRASQQLLLTAKYADGASRDLTSLAKMTVEGDAAALREGGYLVPRKDGNAVLVVKAGDRTVKVPISVKDFDKPQPVSFRREVVAAMNVGGCNAGACHGTPSGKNGFKLSLRGFDPAADFLQLTRDVLGRRTDRLAPESSLIYQKALGRVPHEGGARFSADSVAARAMRDWLAEGLRDDPANLAPVKSVQVLPGARVQLAPARWQQVAVVASFADGSTRDVTRLTVFSSSDSAIADVSASGLVEFRQAGEVAILCRYLDQLVTVRLTYLEPRPGFVWKAPPEINFVDKHTFAKLKMLSLPPSDLCSDADFVRRAYLDLCGILPPPAEATAFLNDKNAGKRARLIDALLERPEYADFWTLKWSDVLRSSRKAIEVKGVHVFQHWLHGHIAANTPMDEVVRELLTASGSTFANPPANYFRIARDPPNLAETTAQLFLGVRMQCAKCHNHPFERWTQDDYYSMAAFFARVRQKKDATEVAAKDKNKTAGAEIIFVDRNGEVTQPRTGKVMAPKFMGGPVAPVPQGTDRREALAAWMTGRDNPFFARAMVNRVWYHLMGRGIVEPVDDFRDSNPPANDELLDALASDFVAHHYDVKALIRTIMKSRTYQLSAETNAFNKDDAKYFSHAVTKLLTAEQLLDAISAATEVAEKFPGLPLGTRAVQLPDGEMNHPFLKTFNQPARELACECERETDSNLAQALQLINGPTVNDKLRNPNNRLGRLLGKGASDREVVTELYLATLSRPPTEAEIKLGLEHINKAADKRKKWEDLHWALLNAKEFLFRH